MARNRRNQSAIIVLGPLLKFVMVAAVFAFLGIQYVWLKNRCTKLGQQIRVREAVLAETRQAVERLRKQVLLFQTPAMIESRLRELNLGLLPPGPWQEVFVLAEPGPEDRAVDLLEPPKVAHQAAMMVPR